MKTFNILTLGCKVNHYETRSMIENFENRGYKFVGEDEKADIYIINTCTVTNLSDRKSRQHIRKVKRINEDAVVGVVGCYSQVNPEEVAEIEGVDIVIGTTERNKIVDLCEEFLQNREKINIVRDISEDRELQAIDITSDEEMTRAYIKVQDGCNMYCAYCIIPYARGNIRSRAIEDCVRETKVLVENGFKELVLTGIHIASYGYDLGKERLIDLIEAIAETDIERIRLSSIDPRIVTEDFIKRLTATGKVCDHFHLSLQNGSDKILKLMNRRYTADEYADKVNIIRKYMPEAGITTDIIVGFPQETEEDFQKTLEFVDRIKFSRIHVFKYSPRKGTPAVTMEGQVHGQVKHERSLRLIEKGEELKTEFIAKMEGKKYKILFEEEKNGVYYGYTDNYVRVKTEADYDLKNKIVLGTIISDEEPATIVVEKEDL